MADKNYKLKFALSDGNTQEVTFTVPQGPRGPMGPDGPQGPVGPQGASIKGDKGDQGPRGIGIASIDIETSNISGGQNFITINMDEGDPYHFAIRNGQTGSKGDKGDQGVAGVGITSVSIEEVV